ncbi:MAG: CCA tRNA nucleotidyltransferase [Firmicutes bacterium HGW-Firmicutes-21]|nr:MAG: CCA tRNA nucleotidyltransferase [Firmicutes bacterium HGW-Firmicutes-21]
MLIKLDNTTEYILSVLEKAGFSAYIVGGLLRDLLLGNPTHDIDIATNALPGQVKELFAEYPVIDTGIKHGTVTLLIEHIPYEITTFRTEGIYSDNRRPDTVSFTDSIEQDLKRRDFTINALAYNNTSGLVDLFGGLDDLNNRVLRAVGEPKNRFSEDSLRIIRALRFSSVLDLEIEPQTKSAMFGCSHLLRNIAVERIFNELINILGGVRFDRVLRELFPIFSLIMPEIVLPSKDVTPLNNPFFILSALFKDEYDARRALHRLKADNDTVKRVTMLISSMAIPDEVVQIKLLLSRIGTAVLDIALFRELFYEEKGTYERVRNVLESGECYSLGQLALNGADIVSLGFSGAEVGEVLKKLLDMVISGNIENKKEALVNAVKSIDKN